MQAKAVLLSLGLAAAALTTTAAADPAIYRDNKMTISAGAVINGTTQQYYKDIVLAMDATGKMQVVAASQRPLVHIDSITPTVVENDGLRKVTLKIAGNKSVPCVKLEEAAVSRKNEVFTILVAESIMGPAESCIAIIDPFELTLPLDVSGLHSGTYKVVVNGKEGGFVLTKDEVTAH